MSQAEKTEAPQKPPAPGAGAAPKGKIHRVCITCNNMFVVGSDNYEAKQCPNCKKHGGAAA